jgi:hypothetical protein
MKMQLKLNARDVTLNSVPELRFEIQHGEGGYVLEFGGNRVTVPNKEMDRLFRTISDTTHVDWQYSKDADIQRTFRPLNRVIQCITTTPSYQLFLAGLHIADVIGMLNLDLVDRETVPDSFLYLVGNLPWRRGKQGRLFILRQGEIPDQDVRDELIANGKLFGAQFFVGDAEGMQHVSEKLIVPYATPIGFKTPVGPQTEQTWRRISEFVSQHGGGFAQ